MNFEVRISNSQEEIVYSGEDHAIATEIYNEQCDRVDAGTIKSVEFSDEEGVILDYPNSI